VVVLEGVAAVAHYLGFDFTEFAVFREDDIFTRGREVDRHTSWLDVATTPARDKRVRDLRRYVTLGSLI